MPVEYKDYYKTLGVAKGASTEEIKRAYRKLARQHHPDLNKDATAERRFKEINEAQEVLSDPGKRSRYDQLGSNWEQFARGGAGDRGGDFQWVFTGSPGAAGRDSSQFSDFFRMVFGDLGGIGDLGGVDLGAARTNGRRPRARAQTGKDLEHEIEVTLADAYRGTERTIEVRREDGTMKRLDVRIPAGVRDGQRIRLAGQGSLGHGGAAAGDLYLRVRVRPHPFFRREGDDLYADLPVSLHEALLGAEVSVPTVKGRVSLKVPAETQNGRTIRLGGQGMPRATGGHGDLFVTVKVVLPQKLSDEERESVRRIADRRRDENVREHLL